MGPLDAHCRALKLRGVSGDHATEMTRRKNLGAPAAVIRQDSAFGVRGGREERFGGGEKGITRDAWELPWHSHRVARDSTQIERKKKQSKKRTRNNARLLRRNAAASKQITREPLTENEAMKKNTTEI